MNCNKKTQQKQVKTVLEQRILERFFVRQKGYGQYQDRVEGKKARGVTRKGEVTSALLTAHLNGKSQPLGVHSQNEHEQSRWLCLDYDGSKAAKEAYLAGDNSLLLAEKEKMLPRIFEKGEALQRAGLYPLLEDSVGGFHLWVFLPIVSQKLAFDLAHSIDTTCPEAFPKSGEKSDKGFGNWVRLPGRYHSTEEWCRVWDWHQEEWISLEDRESAWDYILSIPTTPIERAKAWHDNHILQQQKLKEEMPEQAKVPEQAKPDTEHDRCVMSPPDPVIDDALRQIKMADVLCLHFGMEIEKDDHFLCKFHEDTTPSGFIAVRNGIEFYCCAGNCKYHKNGQHAVKLLMLEKGLAYPDACELLGIQLPMLLKNCDFCDQDIGFIDRRPVNPDGSPHYCPPAPKIEFPGDALPEVLADYCRNIAKALCCPIDYVAGHALAICGAMIGNSHRIRVKRSHIESASLYHCTVARPGDVKSPPLKILIQSLSKIEEESRTAYQKALELYEIDLELYEDAAKEARKKNTAPTRCKPEKPIRKRCLTTNPTAESLAKLLEENPRGLLLYKDEMSGMVTGFNQYKGGRGDDQQLLLSTWSNIPIFQDRVDESKKRFVPVPFLCLLGNLTPDNLPTLRGQIQDGFIDRFLFSYPPPIEKRRYSDHEISEETEQAFEVLVRRLSGYRYAEQKDTVCIGVPQGAKKHYVEFFNGIEKQKSREENLAGVWSKFQTHVLRIALILTLVEADEDFEEPQCTEDIMFRSIKLARYFMMNARKVFVELETPEEEKKALKIVQWLKKKGKKTATVREIARSKVCGTQRIDKVREFVRILVELGEAKWQKKGYKIELN